jgi:hypothetical protein
MQFLAQVCGAGHQSCHILVALSVDSSLLDPYTVAAGGVDGTYRHMRDGSGGPRSATGCN